ncbi:hypothetical protein [Natrinema thermotolerans]|uniref:hypothetical protein n=1 Tax=Natrinema thermotolerans TaxID=121872 RepID=UPI0010A49F4C|nr:hypothetical protein [Natrinema thermotolerans]
MRRTQYRLGRYLMLAGVLGLLISPALILIGPSVTDTTDETEDTATSDDWDELQDAAASQSDDRTLSDYAATASDRWSLLVPPREYLVGMVLVLVTYSAPALSLLVFFTGGLLAGTAQSEPPALEEGRADG